MKQNILATITCVVSFFIYGNCQAQNAASPGLSAIKKTNENTNAVYFDLFAKKDGAIVDLYTYDACLLAPNAPTISGRKALKKDFEDTFAAGTIKGVKFKTGNIYGDGKQYVTEEGTWEVFDPSGKLLDDGKYLKLWKRTTAGWKIFRDLFNSNYKVQR